MVTGTGERINEILGTHCSGGYGGGSVGQANWQYLHDKYQGVEWLNFGAIYRLGDTVRFRAPIQNANGDSDSRRFGEFLEDLSRLEDYPILDDDTYNDLIMRLENEEWESLVSEHKLDWDYVNKVIGSGDYYWEDSDGMGTVYGLNPSFDVAEFVTEVRREEQTWKTHYYSTLPHYPDLCWYCEEAKK